MLYETIAFPDNAPLQCSIVEVEEYPFHMHDDVLEIMFALEGSFELTVVNNVLDMKAGDIYVSCPRELHRLCAYPHTRGTVMLLHINVEAYRAEFPDLRTYQFANSALENNTAGIQMLGSYLKKQLPRLLDGDGCLQGGGGEDSQHSHQGVPVLLSGQRLSRVQQRLQGKRAPAPAHPPDHGLHLPQLQQAYPH